MHAPWVSLSLRPGKAGQPEILTARNRDVHGSPVWETRSHRRSGFRCRSDDFRYRAVTWKRRMESTEQEPRDFRLVALVVLQIHPLNGIFSTNFPAPIVPYISYSTQTTTHGPHASYSFPSLLPPPTRRHPPLHRILPLLLSPTAPRAPSLFRRRAGSSLRRLRSAAGGPRFFLPERERSPARPTSSPFPPVASAG
jgi:hypothetical protein